MIPLSRLLLCLSFLGFIPIAQSAERVALVVGNGAYVNGEFEDKIEFPVPDPIEKEFTFVAGSIYGGVIIQFAEGKVSGIMLGAGAE